MRWSSSPLLAAALAVPFLTLALAAPAWAACGDGRIDGSEECDDLNLDDGDGCSATCDVEWGWECTDASFSLDFAEVVAPGGTPPSWSLSSDRRTVTQSRNADAAVYMTNLNATWTELTFTLRVNTSSDDDFIGWAVAYDRGERTSTSADWLLFDWKRGDQAYDSCTGLRGLAMSRVTGPVSEREMWCHNGDVREVRRGATLSRTGWVNGRTYTVRMRYTTSRIQVWIDDVLQIDETGTFPEGNFGFYNFSQEAIQYTLVSPVDRSICGELDSDDDGLTDLEELDLGTDPFDADTDGDGSIDSLDCAPTDPRTYPGAPELCDGLDNDCDGVIPAVELDLDDDRYVACVIHEAGWFGPDRILGGGDCADDDAARNPGATEVPYDGVDQDCTGEDLCDVDRDGFHAGIGECFGVDCNDADLAIHPRADEVWYDGVDQDCDGWSDYDADRDGVDTSEHPREDGTFGEDCDDRDRAVNPSATEVWYDGVDQDCDGWSDFDADRDGHDTAWHRQPNGAIGEDCDDADPTIFPGAPSLPDGKDNDCDGITDTTDSDGDGIPDEIEWRLGTDPLRADTDGDGIWDGVEVGASWETPTDTDGDGTIDALDDDDDGDGLPTADETGPTSTPRDADADGTPDYLDTDSDDDGYLDAVEGLVDSDGDGVPDARDLDSDGDGVPDADEVDGDTDDDGAQDRVDPDDDGDGWSTRVENGWNPRAIAGAPDYWAEQAGWEPRDVDDDDAPNYLDPDTDGDGRPDAEEGSGDTDCDALPDVLDPNDDDGPCGSSSARVETFQSGACQGASTTGAPAVFWLGVLALAGVRRRRG
jgi:cysteine-rich repeat protein